MIGLALGAMMAVGVMVALAVSAIAWFVLRCLIFLVVAAVPAALCASSRCRCCSSRSCSWPWPRSSSSRCLPPAGLLIAVGVVVGVLIPLLPILLVVGLTFAIVRLMRRPAAI